MSRMTIVDFHPEHLRGLELANDKEALMMAPVIAKPDYAEGLVTAGPCFTAHTDNWAVIACGGVFKQGEHRGIVWALMTPATRFYMTSITRAIVRFMDGCGIRRIEAAVDAEYEISQRWHELMGFKREGLMDCYTPDGRDAYLYARIKRIAS
jgi:hypothetical protein